MNLKYLPIKRENIRRRPYNLITVIDGSPLNFIIHWNPIAEAFFFDLYDREGDSITLSKKIVYAVDMLDILDDRLPDKKIVPLDPTGQTSKITFDNFMREVKPYIVAGDN